ncbi:dihydroorotate dehydrogenase [Mesobacillus stamsii]|uniref:Dihydroorotate dehydrogenase n=1 Tax=Mesobacillus stamsii TaxID=225347 RepID=A0ABU0FSJ9_9BACI|nr:dihydroorotate dehydrogenase [Mesobacillus stamsii]MDQ0412314.1 dihydroorotate dehydrogenase (NAD+) catalytic subunit [Mesobacillus stamsii]
MANLEVSIGSLKLKNPIMPASGTFGEEMAAILDFNQLGALVPKSITKTVRKGNPTPRICETFGGMINSIGIQSKGLDYYQQITVPFYSKFSSPLISSISADSIDEFTEVSEKISQMEEVAALELNISCPNLKKDGMAFGMDANVTRDLVSAVRQVTDKPLIIKLSPNVTNIGVIALAAEDGGADALTVANTFIAMAIDVHTRKPKIGNVIGGISGPSIKPLVVRLIHQVYQVSNLPIIGCGGVMNGEDAIEMMLAGASAVQVGTANFVHPTVMLTILQEIQDYMEQYQITSLKEIIGKIEGSNQHDGMGSFN